jgi:hypothetical protein
MTPVIHPGSGWTLSALSLSCITSQTKPVFEMFLTKFGIAFGLNHNTQDDIHFVCGQST